MILEKSWLSSKYPWGLFSRCLIDLLISFVMFSFDMLLEKIVFSLLSKSTIVQNKSINVSYIFLWYKFAKYMKYYFRCISNMVLGCMRQKRGCFGSRLKFRLIAMVII